MAARPASGSRSARSRAAGSLADEDRIIQTLTNLLGNAIKFSDPGARVAARRACDGDGQVQLPRERRRAAASPQDKLRDDLRALRAGRLLRRPRRRAAPASGWPSAAASSSGTAAGSGPRATLGRRHHGPLHAARSPDRGSTRASGRAVALTPAAPPAHVLLVEDDDDLADGPDHPAGRPCRRRDLASPAPPRPSGWPRRLPRPRDPRRRPRRRRRLRRRRTPSRPTGDRHPRRRSSTAPTSRPRRPRPPHPRPDRVRSPRAASTSPRLEERVLELLQTDPTTPKEAPRDHRHLPEPDRPDSARHHGPHRRGRRAHPAVRLRRRPARGRRRQLQPDPAVVGDPARSTVTRGGGRSPAGTATGSTASSPSPTPTTPARSSRPGSAG